MGDISLRGKGRAFLKKGSYVDMSEEHEGMESKAEEAKEYAMEEKGYKETKSGKMVKKKTKKKIKLRNYGIKTIFFKHFEIWSSSRSRSRQNGKTRSRQLFNL